MFIDSSIDESVLSKKPYKSLDNELVLDDSLSMSLDIFKMLPDKLMTLLLLDNTMLDKQETLFSSLLISFDRFSLLELNSAIPLTTADN